MFVEHIGLVKEFVIAQFLNYFTKYANNRY